MRLRPWAVGLFILFGLGLLTGLLFLIGNRQQAFAKHVEFYTGFSNLSGLSAGAKVRVSGVDAGKIKAIDIPKNASEKFRLTLEVTEKVHPMIHTDSVVSIETAGVVGDQFVLIKRGGEATEIAEPGATLPSKEPLDISAMMDQASGLLKDVHETVGDIRGRADGALDSITKTVNHADGLITDVSPRIQKLTQDVGRITGHIDTLVADVNAGKGPAGLLLRDENVRRQLQATLSNAQQASVNVNDAAARASQVVSDFQSRQLVQKAQAALENVQAISQQLNATIKDALAEDSMGEDGAANLRQTLSSLNRSTTNLAEDTEALKHNFFFRGFFKKRGFYSLDEITPADYREACERHKSEGVRLWLQGSTLMALGTDGREELSQAGRSQIDAVITPFLNNLSGHLIVVEGYAADGSPAQEFTVARWRADQVRRYLEAHYHLRHSDLGIVPLGAKPPANAGQATWNGAAIMLLDLKAQK